MISLKIKTLDSQDHDFTVDEEITVRQFKEHIATNTGVVPENQRLIYCGRVLNDTKLLKEYNVNGKVVHLVEGAPPRSRATESRTSDSNNTPGLNRRNRDQNLAGRTQFFRNVDGMVVGAMAIPVNPNGDNGRANSNYANAFSTLCLNRIIVARHMLECINNIVNYLDNPEVGLNNVEMDDLEQRTIESTVFEVGISAVSEVEVPQQDVQNFVQVFQGAVSAAFRNSGLTNIEVTQPSSSDPNNQSTASRSFVIDQVPFVIDQTQITVDQINANAAAAGAAALAAAATAAAAEQSVAAGSSLSGTPEASGSGGGGGSAGAGGDAATSQSPTNGETPTTSTNNRNSRFQTTSTRVLAEVIEQMRTVQARFEPYLQQYYDILQNEPTFGENDTTARENSQRVFSSVSEGLHYFAHAQHAISDLMLDLSMAAPRHLYCRPILVDQSSFVTSGITVPNIVTTTDRARNSNNNETTANNNATNMETNQPTTPTPNAPSQPAAANTQSPATPVASGGPANTLTIGRPSDTNRNRQLQVARLIQAVVNSVPMYTDVHVEFSRRNAGDQTTQTSTSGATTSTDSTSTPSEPGQPRVTTATHPTTSTQTRSTSRPQVHVTGLPTAQMRNLRPVPVPSFDRFLPCHSHHVRSNNQDRTPTQSLLLHRQSRNRRAAPAGTSAPPPSAASVISATSSPSASSANTATPPLNDSLSVDESLSNEEYSTPIRIFGSELPIRELMNGAPNPSSLNRIRSDLHAYIVRLFGSPLNESNMVTIFQQIYEILNRSTIAGNASENPSYDALHSVNNLIQHTLPHLVNLILEDDSSDFGMRLFRALIEFVRRLLVILVLCVGRNNAQVFINEMTDLGISPLNESEEGAILAFKRYVRAAVSRQFDTQSLDTSDVNEFLVIRLPQSEIPTTVPNETPMETDDPVTATDEEDLPPITSTPLPSPPVRITENQEPLPSIVVGSASWHNGLPTTWLPVITQDINRQRRASTQGPFSDAYLSGMSSKRRKLITKNKPNGSNPNSILSDGIRHVIQSRNALPVVPVDDVLRTNSQLQEPYGSYELTLRNHVQSRVNRDPEYNAELFPNCSNWLNKKK